MYICILQPQHRIPKAGICSCVLGKHRYVLGKHRGSHFTHTHTHRLRVNTCPSAALTLEEPPVSPGFLLCCAGPMGSKLETEGQEGEARISSLPSLLEEMSTATEAFQTGSGSHWKCLPCGPSFHQVTSSPPLPGSGSTTSSL